MSTSDVLADSLALALARLLAVPVREAYAALWRVGLVQIEKTAATEVAEAAA